MFLRETERERESQDGCISHVVVVHAFYLSFSSQRQEDLCEVDACLVYRVSYRKSSYTEKFCLKKINKQINKD